MKDVFYHEEPIHDPKLVVLVSETLRKTLSPHINSRVVIANRDNGHWFRQVGVPFDYEIVMVKLVIKSVMFAYEDLTNDEG